MIEPGTTYGNGSQGGIPALAKPVSPRMLFLDPNTGIFLKDMMGTDWSRILGFQDALEFAMVPGGAGGSGGGAGADNFKYIETGSQGKTPVASFHCLVTGSTFGSEPYYASGGAGGNGSIVIGSPGYGAVGGSGGGGGGSGGVIFVSARKVQISSTSYLIASGGNGGNGAQGYNGSADGSNGGSGGGGGAGAGGLIIVFTTTGSADAGWTPSDTARFNVSFGNGGLGAAALAGAGQGDNGLNANNGATFYIKI